MHIFALANHTPGRLLTAIPYDYYPEVEWRDDMELGATELYLALADGGTTVPGLTASDPSRTCASRLTGPGPTSTGPTTPPTRSTSTTSRVSLTTSCGAPSPRPAIRPGSQVSPDDLVADLGKALQGAVAQAARDPFQFGFAWNQWDTTSHGAGLVVMASEYDQITSSTTYAAWSGRWLANILGANAWGTSLIVGDGSTFPHCLQHQVANLRGSLNGKPPVLLGAAVEGPNSDQDNGTMTNMRLGPRTDVFKQFDADGADGAKWRDAVQNYPNTEPAIDLTAASFLAFSRMMAGLTRGAARAAGGRRRRRRRRCARRRLRGVRRGGARSRRSLAAAGRSQQPTELAAA